MRDQADSLDLVLSDELANLLECLQAFLRRGQVNFSVVVVRKLDDLSSRRHFQSLLPVRERFVPGEADGYKGFLA